jgi:DNA-binding transcriptional MerR regulator
MKQGDQNNQRYVPISEVASSFGISAQTLRRYEWDGLLHASRKGRTRVYDADDINRIKTILELKSFGLSFEEIRDIVTNPGEGPFGLTHEKCAAQLAFLRNELAMLQDAIAKLERACPGA